jgi:hypothetical protein
MAGEVPTMNTHSSAPIVGIIRRDRTHRTACKAI